ncbi:MAG TPA: PQQ-binding-like beta-propeller repeat protein [Acidimicrobiia bacterium]|nr:PQQ-binding-like beta-propeller repeat protein [Acidimicrobiia bacterium]
MNGPPPRRPWAMLMVIALGGALGAASYLAAPDNAVIRLISPSTTAATTSTTVVRTTTTRPSPSTTVTTTITLPQREPGTVPGFTAGQPWGTTVGLTMFRGNPTRTFYGTGPLPSNPQVLWSYPEEGGMCAFSSVGGVSRQWCGSGWTGQPVVWERSDGTTEVIFGAYDTAVHFLDAATGAGLRPSFRTGDIIKGSVTLDPDGYPLLYFGSRDNKLRIVALDRDEPTELWSLDADAVDGMWNDDWDGNPVVVDDILYEGGENGWFFAIKLNRAIGTDGVVSVNPEIVFSSPGWTSELIALVGRNVSFESSVMIHEQVAYLANSGGRVVGFDISDVGSGNAPIAFDYWVGDDTDATLVSDANGAVYVAAEEERKNDRSRELGQLIKLDPRRSNPYVWGVPVPGGDQVGGLWATPALGDGVIYAATEPGELLAVDAETGEVTWREDIGWHAWSSPVVIDDELLVATCTGELRAYSLSDPRQPILMWNLKVSESCIESTPAVWGGRIFVGVRDGKFYAIG